MRQVVLDTETTGMAVAAGNRVIEIGCVELVERRLTGRTWHQYLNPDRESEAGALRVHGLGSEFLADKPRIHEVVDDFLAFVKDAELIIHNADFDVAFLNAELERCGPHYGRLADHVINVVDTIKLAREMYPGQRVSLDALCKRFDIDNAHRELHGALLDSELLADVYVAMTSGQYDLALESSEPCISQVAVAAEVRAGDIVVVRATASELQAHAARLKVIEKVSGQQLWPQE